MKLKDIMTKDVIAVSPGTTVLDAAQIMKDKNIGAIPICTDEMDVQGILTDRDIVLRVVAAQKDPGKTKCQDVMSDRLVVGRTDMEVESALDLMGDLQVRRLPVVENGKLVGFVSLGDMATNGRFDKASQEALSDISTPSEPRM
ncbi:MAG: CBS domain-containing protein [Peptococcaceae bacterium]|jgi:CBS domain-containing protein|nr:CBS domain-containing protein [Peptococcaceae bacterium]MDH7524985.1 CBS domain-containing protein [Peptococcaceae bacterium]